MGVQRTAADRLLLAATLVLLAPAVGAGGYLVHEGLMSYDRPADSAEWLRRAVDAAAYRLVGPAGGALAWGAVAWRCRGVVPRGLALAAALGYAAVGGVVAAGAAGVSEAVEVRWLGWPATVFSAATQAGWLSAVPLLALER